MASCGIALLAAGLQAQAPQSSVPSDRPTPVFQGRYVTARASVASATLAVGGRVLLVLDITPGDKMHVYAPGQEGYIPVKLTLTASPDFKSAAPTYAPSRPFYFEPLKETVKIYDRPFRITQAITLAATPALRKRLASGEALTVSGRLDYQACDDAICYRPDVVNVSWVISPPSRR